MKTTTIENKENQITLVKRIVDFAADKKSNCIHDSIWDMVKSACLFQALKNYIPDIQHHTQVVRPNVDSVKSGYCEVYYLKLDNMIFGIHGERSIFEIDQTYRKSTKLLVLHPNKDIPETEKNINEQGIQFIINNFPNRKDDILNEYHVIEKMVAEIVQDILMEINTAPATNKRQQLRL